MVAPSSQLLPNKTFSIQKENISADSMFHPFLYICKTYICKCHLLPLYSILYTIHCTLYSLLYTLHSRVYNIQCTICICRYVDSTYVQMQIQMLTCHVLPLYAQNCFLLCLNHHEMRRNAFWANLSLSMSVTKIIIHLHVRAH